MFGGRVETKNEDLKMILSLRLKTILSLCLGGEVESKNEDCKRY